MHLSACPPNEGYHGENGNEARQQALNRAEVEEWTANETACCTNQLAYFNFVFLREYLQANGVAGDEHDGYGE